MLKDVMFSLGGMLFEYDEEKNQANIKSMASPSEALPVCSLIMTESSCMTKKTARMKTDLIRLVTHLPELFPLGAP